MFQWATTFEAHAHYITHNQVHTHAHTVLDNTDAHHTCTHTPHTSDMNIMS